MTQNSTDTPVVVVGVDGSSESLAALTWAERYARLTGARLDAEKAVAGVDLPSDRVGISVVEGSAGPAIVKHAADAELLVVGSRGHTPVGSALLGSVSAYCLHRATVSVVVVR